MNHSIKQRVYLYQVEYSYSFYVDIPFTNGEFNSMLFRDMNVDDIECDESILVFKRSKEVDSINFKNAIILPFELPEFEKDIEEMIIEEGFGNDYFGNLIIQNYPNLQSIIVKKNLLQNLKSLKICNCEKLKTIVFEEGVFYIVKKVIIEST